jgi:hypothetical protein
MIASDNPQLSMHPQDTILISPKTISTLRGLLVAKEGSLDFLPHLRLDEEKGWVSLAGLLTDMGRSQAE